MLLTQDTGGKWPEDGVTQEDIDSITVEDIIGTQFTGFTWTNGVEGG